MGELLIPILALALIFMLVAFLYSSVGLGGGSSYSALLIICGGSAALVPMVSLVLNLIVTSMGSLMFFKHRHLRWRLLAPFLIASIPMSYVGGALQLPKEIFYWVLMISLIFASLRIYLPMPIRPLSLGPVGRMIVSLIVGGVLGLVAGIAGIGGGIYLVPLIVLFGLGTIKEAAACGAVFIWFNSIAGLIARSMYNSVDITPYLPLTVAVLGGGSLGAYLGSSKFNPKIMQRVLGVAMLVAIGFLAKKISA